VRTLEEKLSVLDGRNEEAVAVALDDLWHELGARAAWMIVVDGGGEVLAAHGRRRTSFSSTELQQVLDHRTAAFRVDAIEDEKILVGVFPCRCATGNGRRRSYGAGVVNVAYRPGAAASPQAPTMVEVALYTGGRGSGLAGAGRPNGWSVLIGSTLFATVLALVWSMRRDATSARTLRRQASGCVPRPTPLPHSYPVTDPARGSRSAFPSRRV
jgi:hypothetical protein